MRWRRGLFRVWICLSIFWTAVLLMMMFVEHSRIEMDSEMRGSHFGWPEWWLMDKLRFVSWPWILTAIGFGLRWIIRGFRAS
jgi:hypothetical protein